jgi:hypothetical protein
VSFAMSDSSAIDDLFVFFAIVGIAAIAFQLISCGRIIYDTFIHQCDLNQFQTPNSQTSNLVY